MVELFFSYFGIYSEVIGVFFLYDTLTFASKLLPVEHGESNGHRTKPGDTSCNRTSMNANKSGLLLNIHIQIP